MAAWSKPQNEADEKSLWTSGDGSAEAGDAAGQLGARGHA